MNVQNRIRSFVRIAARLNSKNLDELEEELDLAGIHAPHTECLIAFVPMGFTHGLFDGFDIRFPAGYEIRNPQTGETAHGELRDEPIYLAARKLATTMVKGDESACRMVMRIAALCPELGMINQLVRKGTAVADIEIPEPVLSRLPLEHLTRRRRKWRWLFWK